jgi:hypothetical protein
VVPTASPAKAGTQLDRAGPRRLPIEGDREGIIERDNAREHGIHHRQGIADQPSVGIGNGKAPRDGS